MQVVDARDVRVAGERGADLLDARPRGRGLEEHPAGVAQEAVGGDEHDRRRSRATATPSARVQPVARMTTPATAVSTNASDVGEAGAGTSPRCSSTRGSPAASCHVASSVTAMPTSATISDRRLPGRRAGRSAAGSPRRRSGTRARAACAPFACADRISVRLRPKVRLPAAGRSTRRITTSDSTSAPASVSMCAASESSASESARIPATTSAAMNPAIRPSAIHSRLASASGLTACECPSWPSTLGLLQGKLRTHARPRDPQAGAGPHLLRAAPRPPLRHGRARPPAARRGRPVPPGHRDRRRPGDRLGHAGAPVVRAPHPDRRRCSRSSATGRWS